MNSEQGFSPADLNREHEAAPALVSNPAAAPPQRLPRKDSTLLSADDFQQTIGLIESIAPERQRRRAAIQLVKYTANALPGTTVRCGLGTNRMRLLFDCRLGWINPTSELFEKTSAIWEDDEPKISTQGPLPATTPTPQKSDSLRLNIDDRDSLGRCSLWIDGRPLTWNERAWLRKSLPTLRVLMWDRSGGMFGSLGRSLADAGTAAKIYIALICLFLLLLSIWPVSYRVRCSTLVRPQHSRAIASPFAATLEQTYVSPGDAVKAGDPLISLDGRPLRMELESIEAQIARHSKERDIALVGGKVAQSQQAELKIRELSRRRDLLQSRLSRLLVTSPIDGIVVTGDLHRSVGVPLETGQAVLEIASLESMVIELEIPEYDVGYVGVGLPVRVRLSAASDEVIDQSIDAVYPSAQLRDDQNVFVATVNVDNASGKLRPGMRGDAIAYGPVRPWLWSYARTGWERLLWWIGY